MGSRAAYLVNQPTPSLVKSSEIDCREGAVRITCLGMGSTGNAWQVWVGSTTAGAWVNVVRYGVPVIFNSNMTQYVEMFAGRYRVDPTGLLSTAVVFAEEDEQTDHDAKILYTFAQQNNNQNGITAENTASNTSVGNGTAANPLGFNVKYSNDGANLAHAGMDGAVDATINLSTDPSTAALSGTGTVGSPLAAAVTISADAGNGLSIGSDSGLFATAGSTPTNLDHTDAVNIAGTFVAGLFGSDITVGTGGVTHVVTTSDTIYAYVRLLGSVLNSAVVSSINIPTTMPASGSIGATNVNILSATTTDNSTGSVVLCGFNNTVVVITGTLSETVNNYFAVAFTLQ